MRVRRSTEGVGLGDSHSWRATKVSAKMCRKRARVDGQVVETPPTGRASLCDAIQPGHKHLAQVSGISSTL